MTKFDISRKQWAQLFNRQGAFEVARIPEHTFRTLFGEGALTDVEIVLVYKGQESRYVNRALAGHPNHPFGWFFETSQ
jgi:hypothetical protein